MKVFISWSGELSKKLGEVFRTWLPTAIQNVKPYFTPDDIEKGARWSSEIAKELEDSKIGIFFLTRENLKSSWLLFEAGALSKTLDKSHVCLILFGVGNTDLPGPLSQFQTTKFKKSEIKKLMKTINSALENKKLAVDVLDQVFDMWWPKLDEQIREILQAQEAIDDKPIRTDRELLEEILSFNRVAAQRLPVTSISLDALDNLLRAYINTHNSVCEAESYQEILVKLKLMSGTIKRIIRFNPRFYKIAEQALGELTFTFEEPEMDDGPQCDDYR